MPILRGTRHAVLAGGGVSASLPLDGLTLWLSADAVTGLSDGESITGVAIPDQSGNGRNFTGVAGTFETGELNGYPVLRNTAGGQIGNRAATSIRVLFGLNTCTIYVLYRYLVGNNTRILYEGGGHLTINWNWANRIYWVHLSDLGAGLSMNEAQPAGWADAFHLLECWRNGANGEIRYNNGSLLLAETDAADNLHDLTTTVELCPQSYGDFVEIISYDRALGDAERQQVRDYINQKYALW